MTGNMRQGSRSPPFLIVGLLVALCILAFNYWNISNKNGDLKRQFEELQIDFRTVTDKHLKVETRASDLTARLSEMQSNKDQVDKDLAEKNKRVQDLTNEVQSLQQELKTVKENLQKAEANSQNVVQEKQSLNGELEKLKAELTELKNAPVHCDQQACRDPIRALITALTTHIGKPAVAGALKQNNVEVMQIAADLLEGADQQQNQPKLPEAADGQQRQAGQQQPPAGQPPAQVVGAQDPNVVNMQQAAASGVNFPQGGGGGNNLLFQVGQKPPQEPSQDGMKQSQQGNNDQNIFRNGLPGAQLNLQEGKSNLKAGSVTAGPKIVAQNLPSQNDEDGVNDVPNVLNNNNDLDVGPAQEDLENNHQMDLPEDEMDKQAAANQGAEDLGHFGDVLHHHLQDLSKNGGNNEGNKNNVDLDTENKDEQRPENGKDFEKDIDQLEEKQERNNAQETAKKDDENKDENKEETENEKTDAEDKKKEEEPRDLQEAEKHFETQKAEKSLLTLAGTDRNNRNNFTALTLLTRDQGNTIVEKMQFPGQLSAKKSIQRPSNAISNLEDEEEDLEKESTDFDDAVQTTTLTLTREVEERENIISLNGPIKTKDFPADQGLKRENVDAVRVDSRRSSSEQIGKTAV